MLGFKNLPLVLKTKHWGDFDIGQNRGCVPSNQNWLWKSHSHPAVSHTHSDHRGRSRPGWTPQNIRKITFFALRRTPKTQFFLERGGALRALNARFLGLDAECEIITLFGLFDHWGFPLFKIETRFPYIIGSRNGAKGSQAGPLRT